MIRTGMEIGSWVWIEICNRNPEVYHHAKSKSNQEVNFVEESRKTNLEIEFHITN